MTASPSTFKAEFGGNAARAIPAGRRAVGSVWVPPSKSVTHRYLNLALLAGVPLVLERPLDADDTRLFQAALAACGFAVERVGQEVRLTPGPSLGGRAHGGEPIEIFCGNAGTMFRFLVATLAAIPGRFRLDGTPRLRERPIGPLVDAVRRLGGEVAYLEREGYAPLAIRGGTLRGGKTGLDAGSSSQYLSALLMAGLAAREPVIVELSALTSEPYIEITLSLARRFGGRIDRVAPNVFRVEPSPLAAPERVRVEGDWSAAAYPAAMAVLTEGEVRLLGLEPDSAQGDRRFLDLLVTMGAEVSWHEGVLTVGGGGRLTAVTADLSGMPDQVPTLAALAPFAAGTTRITDVPHLRIKESDRLHAMAVGLAALGVPVRELPDGLEIEGVWAGRTLNQLPSDPVLIDPFDDHRIAMSFALLGLGRAGVSIADPGVVAKSYPEFWRDFDALTPE